MGNINLYKSSNASGPWTLVKENVPSPVTVTDTTGGSLYYAVRDEGDGGLVAPSAYKAISSPVYVYKTTDKISSITFDDTTNANALIIKVTSTCSVATNQKVKVQINPNNKGWRNLGDVAIGTNKTINYTPTTADDITEGCKIKFRAYIFNTTNTNYRTNNSAEYTYTFRIVTDIDVRFKDLDADYYYLQSSRTGITNIDTIDAIKFIDIQGTTIRLKDINYLSTQISNANANWSFNITIHLKKIGIQKSVIKNIALHNNLFNIDKNGNIKTGYNMIIDSERKDKGYTIPHNEIIRFSLAGSAIDNHITSTAIGSICDRNKDKPFLISGAYAHNALYYVTLGKSEICSDGRYYRVGAVLLGSPYTAEAVYNTLAPISSSTLVLLSVRIDACGYIETASNYLYSGYIIY